MSQTVELLPQSTNSVLCIRLRGMVTLEDYLKYFDAPLHQIAGDGKPYSLYAEYAPDFEGWSPEAADASFKSITSFGPRAVRCAYVNPPKGRFMMMRVLEPIMSAQVRYFNTGEEEDALRWVHGNDE